MKQIVWLIARPFLVAWLKSRALRLPAAKQSELATKLGVNVVVVGSINDEVVTYVIGEIEGARL
jgi:hypothetical protein